MVGKVEKCVLKCFGHNKRMSEERLTWSIHVSGVDGTRKKENILEMEG